MNLGFRQPEPVLMHCDNESAIYIFQNPVFHEKSNTLRLTVTLSKMLGLRR